MVASSLVASNPSPPISMIFFFRLTMCWQKRSYQIFYFYKHDLRVASMQSTGVTISGTRRSGRPVRLRDSLYWRIAFADEMGRYRGACDDIDARIRAGEHYPAAESLSCRVAELRR